MFKEYLQKWIGLLFKSDYLKIIYYLLQNKFCHPSGLVKTFHEDVGNVSKRLHTLAKYHIIQIADRKKYNSDLYKHRKAFGIDDWHFEKAYWYTLTDLGRLFFKPFDFSISLDSTVIDRVKNWKKHLIKKKREIEVERKQQNSRLDELLPKYRNLRMLRPELDPIEWAEDKIKRGFVDNISPHDLVSKLDEMNKRVGLDELLS